MFLKSLVSALAAISAVSALPVRMPLPMRMMSKRQTPTIAADMQLDVGGNVTAIPQGGAPKVVMSHYMVGNAYANTIDTWKSDIGLAQGAGIDAFVLNIGPDSWQSARVADAFSAAQQLNSGFKLCMSFDMTVLPADAGPLVSYVQQYASHGNQLQYNGKVFVTTFAGSDVSFGQSSPSAGWQSQFIQPLSDAGIQVWFAPAFFIAPTDITGTWNSVLNGIVTWNSGWPTDLTSASLGVVGVAGQLATGVLSQIKALVGSLSPDQDFISAVHSSGKSYVASISPFFFTHYGPDSWNKNWIYVSDDHLYSSRWDTIIQNRDQIDMVEILTWNDYGESSYIGPIGASQPNSQAWVNGFNHTDLLSLTAHYAAAYKTGAFPAVTQDLVVLSARPHTKGATASADSVGKPTNWELASDKMWVDLILTAPATIVMQTSDGNAQTVQTGAGTSRFSMDLTVGGYIQATVQRNGQTVVTCKPDGYSFTDTPTTYNFNSFVAGCSSS